MRTRAYGSGSQHTLARLLPAIEPKLQDVGSRWARKRADQALRHTERWLDLALNASDICLWSWNVGTNELSLSPRWIAQLGYKEDDIPNTFEEWATHIHPDDRDRLLVSVPTYLQEPAVEYEIEFRLRHRDGSYRWVLSRARLSRDDDGQPEQLLGCHIDITDRKQTEDALRNSEQHFRTLIEEALDLVAILDADGTYRYASPSHEQASGFTSEELVGHNAFEFLHPADVATQRDSLARALREGRAIATAEYRFRHKDGSWRIIEGVFKNLLGDPLVRGILVNARDITEHKAAEDALRTSEERFKVLVEHAPEAIVVLDVDSGRFVYANANAEHLFGYCREELFTFGPDRLYAAQQPDGRPISQTIAEHIDRTLAGEEVLFERVVQTADGQRVDCEVRLVRLPPFERKLLRASLIDITERKRMEGQLLLQTSALAAAANAIVITDTEGSISWVNRAFTELTGYTSAEVIGGTPRVLKSGTHDRSFYERLWDTIRAGNVWSGEVVNRRKDGSLFTEEMTITPVGQNGVIRHFIAIKQDISRRKRAETAEHEEARIAAALARMGRELIAALDTPGFLDRLCQVTTEVLGCDSSHTLLWQPEQNAFTPIAGYGATPEEQEAARVMKVPRALMAGLLSRLDIDEVTQVGTIPPDLLSKPEQERFGVALTLCMALRRGNELIGIQTAMSRNRHAPFTETERRIATGIAQIASLALEHGRMVSALESANRLKSDFVATMSHELRTPINIITGYIDLLLEGAFGMMTPEQVDTLQRVHGSSRELLDLVNTTLDVSRLETGRMEAECRDVDLPRLIDEIDGETRGLQERSTLSFLWKVAPDLRVRTDPAKLKLVLKNLVGNAIKFTDQGSVTLEAAASDGGVEIIVADTGIGIPSDALPIIFEPFRQADSSNTRRHGGVGLGLYIVRRVLDTLGGSIAVESKVGCGSTFRVHLPTSQTST